MRVNNALSRGSRDASMNKQKSVTNSSLFRSSFAGEDSIRAETRRDEREREKEREIRSCATTVRNVRARFSPLRPPTFAG